MQSAEPLFSVIVPTYARPPRLRKCLEALARLAYPADRFEVIVVDDGSPTSLEPVMSGYRNQLNVTLLRQDNRGPAAARNTGAAHAKGGLLAFTDDDCAPDPGWLRALAKSFAAHPDHMLGGRTLNALPDNPYATATDLLMNYLYAYGNHGEGKARFLASNNLAVPAQAFRDLHGFSTAFPRAGGEDREFCYRWLRGGRRATYVSEAVVHHAHALTLRRFWRQHFNYGRGAACFHRMRAERGRRLLPEPLSFYLDLLRFPLRHDLGIRAWRYVALLGLAQVASALGIFWEALSARKTAEALAP